MNDMEKAVAAARWAGLMAFRAGECPMGNPHNAPELALRRAWREGWECGYAIREGREYQGEGS